MESNLWFGKLLGSTEFPTLIAQMGMQLCKSVPLANFAEWGFKADPQNIHISAILWHPQLPQI